MSAPLQTRGALIVEVETRLPPPRELEEAVGRELAAEIWRSCVDRIVEFVESKLDEDREQNEQDWEL